MTTRIDNEPQKEAKKDLGNEYGHENMHFSL
jgi:hypothetical protein